MWLALQNLKVTRELLLIIYSFSYLSAPILCQALNYALGIHKVNKTNEISTLMKLMF